MAKTLNINPEEIDTLSIPDRISSDALETMRYIEAAEDEADYAGDFDDDINVVHEITEEDVKNTSEYVGKTSNVTTSDITADANEKKESKYPANFTLKQYKDKKLNDLNAFFEQNNMEYSKEYMMEILSEINSSVAMGMSFDQMDEYINFRYSYRQMDLLKTSILLDPSKSVFNQIKDRSPEDMVKLIRLIIENEAIKSFEKEVEEAYNETINNLEAEIVRYKEVIKEFEFEQAAKEEKYLEEIEELKNKLAASEEKNNNMTVKEPVQSVQSVDLSEIITEIKAFVTEKDERDQERFSKLQELIVGDKKETDKLRKIRIKKNDSNPIKENISIIDYANEAALDANQIKVITTAIEIGVDDNYLKKIIDQKEDHRIMMEKLRLYAVSKRKEENTAKANADTQ